MGSGSSKTDCSKCEYDLKKVQDQLDLFKSANERLKEKLPKEASSVCMEAIDINFNSNQDFENYVRDKYDTMFKDYTSNIEALNITYKFVSSCNTFEKLNSVIKNKYKLNYDECEFISRFILLLSSSYKNIKKQKYLTYKKKYLSLKNKLV
jgi:hypothetical protein